MKKLIYWVFILFLVCILIYNIYFISTNIFEHDTEIITIESQDIAPIEYELICSKLKDEFSINEDILIQKCILKERFPTGGNDIEVHYTINESEKITTLFETERNGNETPISDYIIANGIKEYPYKHEYQIVVIQNICIILIIILAIALPPILNKYKRK